MTLRHRSRGPRAASARDRGFTLIELLVVMAVLGILAMAVLPLAEVSVQRDRERELRRSLGELRDAIDAYKHAVDAGTVAVSVGASGYPPSLRALVEGAPNPKASGQMQFFLRHVPRDPFANDDTPAEKTWGLRSYASAADNPRAGDDVYDVYSQAGKVGLNGVPLRDW
jgi:general secretion pathway protein G